MGQYHRFINFDSNEGFDTNGGWKLMEWAYVGNTTTKAFQQLMKTSWKGNKVAVVGDYCNDVLEDESFYSHKVFSDIVKQYPRYDNMKTTAPEYESPFNMINELNVAPSKPEKVRIDRYVINKKLKTYIDLKDCPAEHASVWEGKIGFLRIYSPALLLAVSNGLGGGDYASPYDKEKIGSWIETSDSVEFSNKKPSKEYKYEKVCFYEGWDCNTQDWKSLPENDVKTIAQDIANEVKEKRLKIEEIDSLSFYSFSFLSLAEKKEIKRLAKELANKQ